jgi:hypothetical protein
MAAELPSGKVLINGGVDSGDNIALVHDQLLNFQNLLHDIEMHKDNPTLVGIADIFHSLEHLF